MGVRRLRLPGRDWTTYGRTDLLVMVFDAGDSWPIVSRATTEYEYAVDGLRPLTVAEVPDTVATTEPFWRTS